MTPKQTTGQVTQPHHAARRRPAKRLVAGRIRTESHYDGSVVGKRHGIAIARTAWQIAESDHAGSRGPTERLAGTRRSYDHRSIGRGGACLVTTQSNHTASGCPTKRFVAVSRVARADYH
jgi:hypothetical protein